MRTIPALLEFVPAIACGALLLGAATAGKAASAPEIYRQRVETVRGIPGLAAFWDFVLREDGAAGSGRFLAYTAPGDPHRYVLEPHNFSWDYWREGQPATMVDFPLLGRGPFGEAVHFLSPPADDRSHLPVLLVPRKEMHDTPLDAKGPGGSVSMAVWMIHQEGNHAIAGIWHEGTTSEKAVEVVVRERGRRQYALFAGMGGHPGAAGVHVSENGVSSFGDTYARHLAVTPEKLKSVPLGADDAALDAGWSLAGFVFDASTQVATAYLDGVATERWVENPGKDRFYRFAARAWRQAQFAKQPGLQEGEQEDFPRDQLYDPPSASPLSEQVEAESAEERTVLRVYEFTQVRVTQRKNADGSWGDPIQSELAALKVNPYWFGHSLHAPSSVEEGGPFSIGRVLHVRRGGKMTAYLGGVAVYARALTPGEMQALARVGQEVSEGDGKLKLLHFADVVKESAGK